MDSVNMSSTGDTNDVIDLSHSQSDKEHDPQPETPSGSKVCPPPPKPKARQYSEVWEHFTKIFKEGSKTAACVKCNHCKASYAWISANGTSTLRKHIANCPKSPQNKENKKQKTLAFQSVTEGEKTLGVWKFDQQACRDSLVKMVITDELPFRFVEREGFRQFCSVMQPNFKKFSRFTVARDIVDLYCSEKKKLKNVLKNANYRLCLTTDSWTSLQNVSYMCLTAHFIDKDWNLQKRILNFSVISSHKGEAIGKAVESCLVDWGIEKISTITVDNASANDVAIAYVKRKFSKNIDSLILRGEYLHMRCCAHIINLIVKDGLSEIKDSITRIRDAVKYVRSSPQREQFFRTCAETERVTCKSLLCLDVQTRWNSTYLMLDVATKFQKVFERLEDEDPHFKLELNHGPPTSQDWEDANVFTQFLQKFYDATVRLSGSLYVTSNLYFTEVCGIESALTEWGKSLDPSLKAMAIKMKTKFDKYWGKIEKINMMLLIAVVLDPRYKLKYVRFCYFEVYQPVMVSELTQKVRETLNNIFDEYKQFETVASSSNEMVHEVDIVDQVNIGASEHQVSLMTKFQNLLEEEEGDGGKSEVDRYLEESCEKEVVNFDILSWWNTNSSRYKILSQVARDILAIPVSTIASESTFSTGGRILDQFRSSLTPKLVESLICTQDWLRASPLPLQMEENFADLEDIERALTNVNIAAGK
ncbi:unnamed protein product [Camellia sinensis]